MLKSKKLFMETNMKNLLLTLLFIISFFVFIDNILSENDDLIQVAPVEEQEDSTLLDSGIVKPHPTKTFTPIPTFTPEPTSTPKPIIKKTIKKAEPTPIPQPTIAKILDFKISNIKINEIAKIKNINNLYGLLEMEKKFNLILILENSGNAVAFYTTATLKSKNPRILLYEPEKNLQTVLPNDKRELVFTFDVIHGYDGPPQLPLFLNIKAANFEKELPVELYVELPNPNLNLLIIGGILFFMFLFVLLIIKILTSRKKTKKYDFDNE